MRHGEMVWILPYSTAGAAEVVRGVAQSGSEPALGSPTRQPLTPARCEINHLCPARTRQHPPASTQL
jgi:hypothetical protein